MPLRFSNTQLPPTRSDFSKQSNGIPRSSRALAAAIPEEPAPITHTRSGRAHPAPMPGPTCCGGPSGPSSASACPASASSTGEPAARQAVEALR